MSQEKRNKVDPVPAKLSEVMTELQIMALRRIEGFGWELRFVRRNNTTPPIVVVSDPAGKTIGILEGDGRVNLDHKLVIRH